MYLNTETAKFVVNERLSRQVSNSGRGPHRWRNRVGAGLISLGRALSDEHPAR